MSVQDLNRVHRRYITLSNAFKSSWTFHQFLQGLHKVFADGGSVGQPGDFQGLYGLLKGVSENLTETTTESVAEQLDTIEAQLSGLTQMLLGADDEISPMRLRQFFQRVKNYDDQILTQLVKFYLYSHDGGEWRSDRLDKADFLVTKLCGEYHEDRDLFAVRERTHVREAAQGFWMALGGRSPGEIEIAALVSEVEAVRQEMSAVASVDDINQRQVVQRYRDLKHRLGDVFFHPKVLPEIVETNLVLKNRVQELYRREEQRIVAEYQQVFELEREVSIDVQLGEELAEFREAVERFEEQLQGSNVRLDDLGRLRERVRELIPRLKPDAASGDEGVAEEEEEEEEVGGVPTRMPVGDEEEVVGEPYGTIVATLEESDPLGDAKKVALQPAVFALGLEAREIIGYRRLYGAAACNREVEQFLLRAAAVRLRIEQQVEEIKGILDDSAVNRDAPVYGKARTTVRWGDLYVRRFAHLLEQAILDGDLTEARDLQFLRMRLMRAYSGLWLMVHRPT